MMAGESGRSHTGTVHCYYKCGTRKRSGKEACSLKPVRKEPLEQFVVQTALEKVLNDRVIDLLADKLLEYQSQENTRLPVLQAELKEVKRRIDNLVAAIEQGILTPSTKARMEELEQQREALETSILQEQIEKPPITREQILFWFDQFRHGNPADIAFQEKVIDCFVNSIYLFDDRIVVNFNYQEGGRPVSLEEVLSSFLDGNGAPKNALHESVRRFFVDLLALSASEQPHSRMDATSTRARHCSFLSENGHKNTTVRVHRGCVSLLQVPSRLSCNHTRANGHNNLCCLQDHVLCHPRQCIRR